MKHGGIEDQSSSRTTSTKPSETLVEEASTTFENEAISPTLKDGAAPEPEDFLVSPPPPAFDQSHLFKALEVVERDSLAIAESFTSLFDSLRLALSESTSSTIDHMQCFSDAAGRVQEAAIEASARGNRFIISCHRLNEEMKGIDALAKQLKILKRNVDTLDLAVNRLLRIT